MKKLIFACLVTLLSIGAIQAQESVVKVNPFALLGGVDLVSYERAINDQSSFVVSGAIGGYKLAGFKYSSYGFGGQYRYYFGDVLDGFYGGVGVGYQGGNTKVEGFDDELEAKFTSIGGSLRVGKQWIWASNVTLDVNIGARYSSFKYKDNEDAIFAGLKGGGVFPAIGLGVGYAF